MSQVDIHIKLFQKYLTKKQSSNLIEGVYNYCNTLAVNDDVPYLLDSIIETKINELLELFSSSTYLKNLIKTKQIKPEDICNLKQEELNPEKYKSIIERRELEMLKKHNKKTTDVYQCKKCGERKCSVEQRQVRSSDEPMTTFVECVVCGNKFSF